MFKTYIKQMVIKYIYPNFACYLLLDKECLCNHKSLQVKSLYLSVKTVKAKGKWVEEGSKKYPSFWVIMNVT